MQLTDAEIAFLSRHRIGRLATVAPNGSPQVKPVGFSWNPELETLDIYGFKMAASAKFANVQVNPHVAFVVDEVTGQTMADARFMEIRGTAEVTTHDLGSDAPFASEIIRIHPRRVVGVNVDPEDPGFHARNIA